MAEIRILRYLAFGIPAFFVCILGLSWLISKVPPAETKGEQIVRLCYDAYHDKVDAIACVLATTDRRIKDRERREQTKADAIYNRVK